MGNVGVFFPLPLWERVARVERPEPGEGVFVFASKFGDYILKDRG